MKMGKFATAATNRPSQVQKSTMPKVAASTQMSTKANNKFSKTTAILPGKPVRKSKPKKAAIHKSTKLQSNIVQRVAKKAPIKSLRLARKFEGKPAPKNGKSSKMAVQTVGQTKKQTEMS